MKMLSDDDLDLEGMSGEELARAWDLWFTLAQTTNDADPPYTHGVFVNVTWEDVRLADTELHDRQAREDIEASRRDVEAGRVRALEDLLTELETERPPPAAARRA